MPSGSRRTHTKSRNGCGQCKRRKIKCDERGPRCSNCCKREEQCDYELFEHPTSSPRRKRSKNQLSDQSSDRIIKYPSPLPSLPSMNLTHLELMHHYLTNTSLTLHELGDSGKRWGVIVPAQALSHEFLMHALLGVSALHIVQLRGMSKSTSRYLACARTHHNEAVTIFRSTVTEITPTNCTAAVAFSHLLLIFSSGMAQISDALHHHDNIDSLITVLASFRSYWKLFAPVQQWVEDGPLRCLPPLYRKKSVVINDNAAMEALSEILDFNDASAEDDKNKAIYHNAIVQIQHSIYNGSALPRTLWPVFVSDDYLTLLKQQRPMALIILAHGCVLAKYAPYRWFVHNWSVHITSSIAKVIDPVWKPRMSWPLKEWGLPYEGIGDCTPVLSKA